MTMPREKRATCLVVDDSRVVRKVTSRIMEALAFESIEAGDGLEALSVCRAAMPDCVLLDWSMPVMDGVEFVRQLRRESGGEEQGAAAGQGGHRNSRVCRTVRTGSHGSAASAPIRRDRAGRRRADIADGVTCPGSPARRAAGEPPASGRDPSRE